LWSRSTLRSLLQLVILPVWSRSFRHERLSFGRFEELTILQVSVDCERGTCCDATISSAETSTKHRLFKFNGSTFNVLIYRSRNFTKKLVQYKKRDWANSKLQTPGKSGTFPTAPATTPHLQLTAANNKVRQQPLRRKEMPSERNYSNLLLSWKESLTQTCRSATQTTSPS